jgi:PAS domain S-box-containing protein
MSLRRFLVALSAVGVATAVRIALAPLLRDAIPYMTFFAAVIVAARVGGLAPGLVATAASAIASAQLTLRPAIESRGFRAADALGLALFCGIGALISALCESLLRAREAQRLESERLRATLSSIGDGVIVTDAAGRVNSLNPVAERLTGWTSAEARAQDLSTVFRLRHAATGAPVENLALRALQEGAAVELTEPTLLVSKHGVERPIDDSAAPLRSPNGTPDGAVVVFRDVSGRRRVEEELRRSEQELTDFFENASVPLHWAGPDGIILRVNRAELEMLGYSAAEYVGRHVAEFHDDATVIGDILARLAAGQIVRECPARLRCKDGTLKDVLIDSSVLWQDGRFVHTRCFTTDVSHRTRAAEMTGLLAAVVESTEDAVISKTLGGRILSWNQGASALFGYAAHEAIGRTVDLLIPEEERAKDKQALARVARGERVAPFETVRIARDGQRLDVSLTLSPIRDPTGAIIGASSIARDIRQRRELEESLRQADRRKDEFLAVLAHELRNPLAPIRNSVASLHMATLDDPNLRQAANVIERQSRHMGRLLDDLLDVSRITRDKLELRREIVSVQAVLELALEASRPSLDAVGQTISIAAPEKAVLVDADPVRLAQVFSNLIHNASKYSDPGSEIRLSIRIVRGEVRVTIADDGIGIAADTMPSLFDMFSQAAHALDRAQGGLGIGLALVKGLVELHGGRVTARSGGLGQGSEFEVRLAHAAEAPGALAAVAREIPPAGGALRVLIVDDNRDGAESLAVVLGAMGSVVRTAYDGFAAIELAERFQPEVVLLDLGMPRMSGFETARRMRALPAGAAMRLVAITGWGQERDRERTLEAGFDAHFVKPVDLETLRAFLRSAEPRETS